MEDYKLYEDSCLCSSAFEAFETFSENSVKPEKISLYKFIYDDDTYDLFWVTFLPNPGTPEAPVQMHYINAFKSIRLNFCYPGTEYHLRAEPVEIGEIIYQRCIPYRCTEDAERGLALKRIGFVRSAALAKKMVIYRYAEFKDQDFTIKLVALHDRTNKRLLMHAWYIEAPYEYTYVPLFSEKIYLLANVGYENICYSPIEPETYFFENKTKMILYPQKMKIVKCTE